jgi:hypothetical protein
MDESEEFVLASAVSYLIEGQELKEASILLLCTNFSMTVGHSYYSGGEGISEISIELAGNRAVFEILNDENHPATIAIKRAIEAVLNTNYVLASLRCRSVYAGFDSGWRSKMLDLIEGKIPLNQGIPIQDKPRFQWEYLFFRSTYEIAIAKALDEYNLLFLPNCMARFSSPSPQERKNKEADFLVCYEGKWGIIEVDGESTHPNAAQDHQRDRLFRSHGIRVIERYTAKQCIDNPKGVVKEFLHLLKQNG